MEELTSPQEAIAREKQLKNCLFPSHRRQQLVAAIICRKFSATLAADRGAARGAFTGTLKARLRPSALRPVLPSAAKAALEALMQQTRSAVAAISMINLMAESPRITSP